MRAAVVFLPDTALLVRGAAGRADPGAGLRDAAVAALRAAAPGPGGRVVVVAPGGRARELTHPVGPGLGAAGLRLPEDGRPAAEPSRRADVPASVALVLLDEAGIGAPVAVHEIPRADPPAAGTLRALGAGLTADLVVVVGSPSARHGAEAPLADDPRAADVDAALTAGLAAGPSALDAALTALGPGGGAALAVTGWAPWQVALGVVGSAPAQVAAHTAAVVAGAPHVVAAWHVVAAGRATAPTAPAAPAASAHPAPPILEEPR